MLSQFPSSSTTHICHSTHCFFPQLQKMVKKSFLLALLNLLLLQILTAEAAFGVGVGIGSGGGGVWIGGGVVGSQNPSGSSVSGNRQIDPSTVLQDWKRAITDDPLGILKSWVGTNVCSYQGVFCADPITKLGDPYGGSGSVIAGIDLNHANLQGTLVPSLSLLTALSLLHLNSNRFSGPIPSSFRDLSSLTELDLSNNHFAGSFPTVTLQMPNLLYLDLRFNNFSGPIPQDLFNGRLDAIFLNNNQFTGEIPQNLGNSRASVISLANNRLNGEIPFSLGYTGPKLKEILFLNNQLTGCIPQAIGLWQDLQVLDLSYNSLMGHLPDSVSCLEGIEVLNLGHNKLSGELPDMVCNLKRLMNLTVVDNFFSGFSSDCDRLFSRNVFDFSFNCVPGRYGQRPEPECSVVPGGGLNCLRIPVVNPLVCGGLPLP